MAGNPSAAVLAYKHTHVAAYRSTDLVLGSQLDHFNVFFVFSDLLQKAGRSLFAFAVAAGQVGGAHIQTVLAEEQTNGLALVGKGTLVVQRCANIRAMARLLASRLHLGRQMHTA